MNNEKKLLSFTFSETFAMNQNHPALFASTRPSAPSAPSGNTVAGGRKPLFPEAMETIAEALNMQEFNEYVLYKLPWIHTEGMAVDPRETLNETKAIMYAFKHITGVTVLPYQDPQDAVNIQRQYKELLRVVAAHFLWGVFNKGESEQRSQMAMQLSRMQQDNSLQGLSQEDGNRQYHVRNYANPVKYKDLGIPNSFLNSR